MNERIRLYYYDTSSRLVFVGFFEEIEDAKNHFEIIWPLINAPLVIFPSSFTISITWTAFDVTTHDYNCKQYSKCHTDNKDDSSRLRKKIHFRIIRGKAWATTKYAICIELFHINLFCHIFQNGWHIFAQILKWRLFHWECVTDGSHYLDCQK